MSNTPIKSNLAELERLFLSLGDKTRLKLLSLMANEPVPVGFLVDELGESQPKVSRHLAYLRNAGVVNTERDGKWIYYGIQHSDDPDIEGIIRFVIQTLTGQGAIELRQVRRLRTDTKQATDMSKQIRLSETLTKGEPKAEEDNEIEPQSEIENEAEAVFIEEHQSRDDVLEIFLL
jgi:ArsR family transcriptional regulator